MDGLLVIQTECSVQGIITECSVNAREEA